MLPISVCIIGKNEEQFLSKCLASLTPYFSDIIYLDTGSSDCSLSIATSYTQKIYHFDWINDFSAARNYSIQFAAFDWIFVIDCDERIEYINIEAINKFITNSPDTVGRVTRKNFYSSDSLNLAMTERISRLFNKNHCHYVGIIHEQVSPRKTASSITPLDVPICLLHDGYNVDMDALKNKSYRNITLLEKELLSNGPDSYLYFQLGQSYFMLHSYEKACYYFNLGLELNKNPNEEHVQLMIVSYGYSLIYLEQYDEALKFVDIYDDFCNKADFLFLMGLIYMNNALFDKAIIEFEKATTVSDYSIEGVNSYMALYNIGVIYECTGNIDHAITYYSKCKDYPPAKERFIMLSQ